MLDNDKSRLSNTCVEFTDVLKISKVIKGKNLSIIHR